MTGREIASLAAAPPARVIERLRVLEYEGLAEWRTVGNAHMWRLVNGHALIPHLMALFGVDRAMSAELRSSLGRWVAGLPGVTDALLYGSVARGEERPDSDVDVLVIVADGKSKRSAERAKGAVEDDIRARFGNVLSVRVLTEREVRRRPNRGFLPVALHEGERLLKGGRPQSGAPRRSASGSLSS
jgi:predicted nucleotidyltransferase